MTSVITILVGTNGSIQVVPSLSSATPCAFLLLIDLLSLLMNSFITLSVFLTTLRHAYFNQLLGHLSVIGLFDSLLNVSSSVVFRSSWYYLYQQLGENILRVICNVNSMFIEFTSVYQCFILCVISADRSILSSVKSKQSEGINVTSKSLRILQALSPFVWLFTLILVLPLGLQVVESRYYDDRYCCSPSYVSIKNTTSIYPVVLIVIAYYLPLIFIAKSWVSIAKKLITERRRLRHLELVAQQRALDGSSPTRNNGGSIGLVYTAPWSHIWGRVDYNQGEGFRFFVLTGLLILSFVSLCLPITVSIQVAQFQSVYETMKRMMLLDLPVEFRPVVTGSYDTIFIWTRYVYLLIQPIVIITIHKEVRKLCESVLCCLCMHRNAFKSTRRDYYKKQGLKTKRSRTKREADYKTPVLFATEQGLHLRTMDESEQMQLHASPEASNESIVRWTIDPKFMFDFCDNNAPVTKTGEKTDRKVPKMSQTPPPKIKMANDLLYEDVVDKKNKNKTGKSVRFAQSIKEIKLTEGNLVSDEVGNNVDAGKFVSIQPKSDDNLQNRVSFDFDERRSSKTSLRLQDNYQQVKKNNKNKSLELNLIQNNSLNSSSSSLILSLSQRMRNRQS